MSYPKRLIEVDLPIKKISEQARREKSIRHGHISTLHIWWARRPLAACRAVLCAALWPDPGDPDCPIRFKDEAAQLMQAWRAKHGGSPRNWHDGGELRQALLDFIAEFANWDNSTNPDYLTTARALTQTAHEALGGEPGTRPLVVDPFAGGGSIPLEALRVGADAFASDLNPVAVLLNKVVLEYIPKYGKKLAEEVRKWGEWIKQEAEKELSEFYPKDPDNATPIAYLWARTIQCEGPGCGAEVPLIRSLWLAKKARRSVALRIVPNAKKKRVEFEIIQDVKAADVGEGTVRRGSATCPCCGYTTPVASVRKQLKARKGGANDARLMCVVTTHADTQGRFYRLPTECDLTAVQNAASELERRKKAHRGELSLVPEEPTPDNKGHRAVGSAWIYGMQKWENLFTYRQALTLTTLVRLVQEAGKKLAKEIRDKNLTVVVQACLALGVSRLADRTCTLCTWRPQADQEKIEHVFSRQALSMTWDFAEGIFLSERTAGWNDAYEPPARLIETFSALCLHEGSAAASSAISCPLPDGAADAMATDPPYYDAVPYADLSDFFYVWLHRTVGNLYPQLFGKDLTPKQEQAIVWHPGSIEEKQEFEKKMRQALAEGCRILSQSGIGVVVFAHKSTAGWEAQLQAMIEAGWTITASWPIDTEMGTRVNAMGTASLASSIHLVCRPRATREVGDWRDVLDELPKRIHDWMPRLAAEGVVGADAIFACLGPALEIFSRYARVEKASGEVVSLKEYLELVWGAVAKEALGMIFQGAETSGFEEDARLTAMWLWTLSTGEAQAAADSAQEEDSADEDDDDENSSSRSSRLGGSTFTLEYDAARKIAQGLGAHLEKLKTLVEIKGDKARLLPVSERTRTLFGKEEAQAPSARKPKKAPQQKFDFMQEVGEAVESGTWGEKNAPPLGKTTLDRVHQAMILFAAGRSEAIKQFLVEEGVGKSPLFWLLAQALSALYPANSEEKRWVDGVMAKKKGLGF